MRPREFDTEEVIGRALDIFWANGYHATSVEDLCQAMGIARSSFYQAFGCKRDLLGTALDRYTNNAVNRLRVRLESIRPIRTALEDFFQCIIEDAVSGRGRYGCLIGNMTGELAAAQSSDARRLRRKMRRIEDAMRDGLSQAQARGELDSTADIKALAQFLFATVQGLHLVAKVNPDRAALSAISDTALVCLE